MQAELVRYLPTIIFVLILLMSFFSGYKIGLLRKVVSFASLILAIVLARILTPVVSGFINEITNINKIIGTAVYNAINNSDIIKQIKDIPNIASLGKIENAADLYKIPELKNIANLFELPVFKNGFDFANIENSILEIGNNIGSFFVDVICGVLLFIVLLIILKLLSKGLQGVNKIPIIGSVNKVLGGVLGVFETIFLFWIIFAMLKVLEEIPSIASFASYIKNAPFVGEFYQDNLIFNFFADLFTQVEENIRNSNQV